MQILSTAHKQFCKLPPQEVRHIIYKLFEYQKTSQGYIKWLENRPGYRITIGDYRVLFEYQDNIFTVLHISKLGKHDGY